MPVELFFPETVRVARSAFDDACRSLPETTPEEVKHLLARRILGTASFGVRDPVEMRDDALAYISD